MSSEEPLVLSLKEQSEAGPVLTEAEHLGLPCTITYQLVLSWKSFLGKRSPFQLRLSWRWEDGRPGGGGNGGEY